MALSEVWAKGGEGGIRLAEEVIRLCEEPNDFTYSYELEGSIEDKLNQIVQKIYRRQQSGADGQRPEAGEAAGGYGIRKLPDLRGKDPVLPDRRSHEAGSAKGF